MSKWVTFYEDLFNGVSDIKIHEDKESATKFFKNNYKRYFQLSINTEIKLPMAYGYPLRKFKAMSIICFNKNYRELAEQLKAGGKKNCR